MMTSKKTLFVVSMILVFSAIYGIYLAENSFSTSPAFPSSCIEQSDFQCSPKAYNNGTVYFSLTQSTNNTFYNVKMACTTNQSSTAKGLIFSNVSQIASFSYMQPHNQINVAALRCTTNHALSSYNNGFFVGYIWISYTLNDTNKTVVANQLITERAAQISFKMTT